MLPSTDTEVNVIPPKTRLLYTDFKLISQAHYFKIFSALSKSNSQPFTVRVLDFTSEFYLYNPNLAATFFIQELLRLCSSHPDTVIIEDFEVFDKAIAFVAKPYLPLETVIKEEKGHQTIDIEQLVGDVLADLSFLVCGMSLGGQNSSIHIDFDNIYQLQTSKGYVLGDWAKGLGSENLSQVRSEFRSSIVVNDSIGDKEVRAFALKIFELSGIKKEDLQDLQDLMSVRNLKTYMDGLENILSGFNQKDSVKKILKSMLSKEPDTKLKLADYGKLTVKKAFEEAKAEKISTSITQQVSKTQNKIFRFEQNWYYYGDSNIDAVAFKTSKNIQITGIGLFIPKVEGFLKGKLKIVEGAEASGVILISKEVELEKDMPDAKDNIYPAMFGKPLDVSAGKVYSIVSVFQKGPQSCFGYTANIKVSGNGRIVFEFMKCAGSINQTNENKGQFPEIYYSY